MNAEALAPLGLLAAVVVGLPVAMLVVLCTVHAIVYGIRHRRRERDRRRRLRRAVALGRIDPHLVRSAREQANLRGGGPR